MYKNKKLSLLLVGCLIASTANVNCTWWRKPKPWYTNFFNGTAKMFSDYKKTAIGTSIAIIALIMMKKLENKVADSIFDGIGNGLARLTGIAWFGETEEIRKVKKFVNEIPEDKSKTKISMDDVVGNVKENKIIKAATRQFLVKGAARVQNIMLAGPPGTGKTMLVQAMVNKLRASGKNVRFFCPGGGSVKNPYVGIEGKVFEHLMENVRAAGRPSLIKRAESIITRKPVVNNNVAVLFLDEMDALCRQRLTGGQKDTNSNLLTTILLEVHQDKPENKNTNILIIGATNIDSNIDKAVTDRFEPVKVPMPQSSEERKALIDKFVEQKEKNGYTFTTKAKQYLEEIVAGTKLIPNDKEQNFISGRGLKKIVDIYAHAERDDRLERQKGSKFIRLADMHEAYLYYLTSKQKMKRDDLEQEILNKIECEIAKIEEGVKRQKVVKVNTLSSGVGGGKTMQKPIKIDRCNLIPHPNSSVEIEDITDREEEEGNGETPREEVIAVEDRPVPGSDMWAPDSDKLRTRGVKLHDELRAENRRRRKHLFDDADILLAKRKKQHLRLELDNADKVIPVLEVGTPEAEEQ